LEEEMPEDLKTNAALLEALKRASVRGPTADEVAKQRLSFVMGSLKTTNEITRAEVQQILNQQEGKKAP
jgi:hypothetical protein